LGRIHFYLMENEETLLRCTCIISGIRRLIWTAVNGRARILASVPWPAKRDSGFMPTSTQGPRTTDHGAGRAGSVIILFKRRQNSGRKEAQKDE